MFIHYPNHTHITPYVSTGFIFGGFIFGRIFGLVYRGSIFGILRYIAATSDKRSKQPTRSQLHFCNLLMVFKFLVCESSFCFFSTGEKGDDTLGTFADNLLKFTRYSEFRPLATLSYASDIYNGSSIVSRFVWVCCFKTGVGNPQPAGHMRPAGYFLCPGRPM